MSKLIQTKNGLVNYLLAVQYVSQLVERERQPSPTESDETWPGVPAVPVSNQP